MSTRENNNMRLCELSVMTNVSSHHQVSKYPSAPPFHNSMESESLLSSSRNNPYVFSVNGYTCETSSVSSLSSNNNNNNNTAIIPSQIIQIDNFDDVDLTSSVYERSAAPVTTDSRIGLRQINSNDDGKKINDNDTITTVLSNKVGLKAQSASEKSIKKSSVKDKVDNNMLGAIDPMELPTAYPTTTTSNDPAADDMLKKDGTVATKRTGYQFSDYKSIYESACGKLTYDMPEYKSIYD